MTPYQQQLKKKLAHLRMLLAPFNAPVPTVFSSPALAYRMRVEFRIWHDDARLSYAMAPPGKKMQPDTIIRVETFPPACLRIQKALSPLLKILQESTVLREKLYQVEFLSTRTNDLLITLIYHRLLDTKLRYTAATLARQLHASVILRARKEKFVIGTDYVCEIFTINSQPFIYHQYAQSFSQPNAVVCEKMLRWASQQVKENTHHDLLELYCGNGNFTLPLSCQFRRVLATEVDRVSIRALQENKQLNNIDNIDIVRLSANEFASAWRRERRFNRLKQADISLENYKFSTVLVDPPRAGIDANLLTLLQNFEKILYISCNPHTLANNLRTLTQSHSIRASALFDQFPFTDHIEAGVLLEHR